MRIILQEPNEVNKEPEISLTDDGFAVPGWLSLRLQGSDIDTTQEIHVDELHHACIALYSKYRSQLDKEINS